jgi:hypothetical protein
MRISDDLVTASPRRRHGTSMCALGHGVAGVNGMTT